MGVQKDTNTLSVVMQTLRVDISCLLFFLYIKRIKQPLISIKQDQK